MNKIIGKEQGENGASFRIDFGKHKLWFDTWKDDDGEITGDWNKYIFFLTDTEDVAIKAFQEDVKNFRVAMDLVTNN